MVYGINIGNTNVSAAVSQSNRVAVIANAGGEHRSRSLVAKGQETEMAVGTAALNSRNTVIFNNIINNFTSDGGKHVINKQVKQFYSRIKTLVISQDSLFLTLFVNRVVV